MVKERKREREMGESGTKRDKDREIDRNKQRGRERVRKREKNIETRRLLSRKNKFKKKNFLHFNYFYHYLEKALSFYSPHKE